MVPTAEPVADFDKLKSQEITTEVHGGLSWYRKGLGTGLRAQSFTRHSPLGCDDILNPLWRDGNEFR
jgi:hypothetical protein